MRPPRILSRYLVREVGLHASIGLFAIAFVLVGRNALRLADDVTAAGSPAELLVILACLAGMLATYVVPLAFLFGVLVAITRLSGDAEITAMRACGVGLRGLLVPLVALGVVVSAVTAWLVLDVEPGARLRLRTTLKWMATRGTLVEPGRFLDVGEHVLYVREREPDGELRGVLISDRSEPERPLVIFAEQGRLELDERRGRVRFHLRRGDIHVEPGAPGGATFSRIDFETLDYALDTNALLGRDFSSLRPREMTVAQLREVLARARAGDALEDMRRRDPVAYELHLHRRVALPVAPVLFALLAVPLGLRGKRSARTRGALWCAALAFAYYTILSLGQFLAHEGLLEPAAALWAPNAAFATAAGALLLRAHRSPP